MSKAIDHFPGTCEERIQHPKAVLGICCQVETNSRIRLQKKTCAVNIRSESVSFQAQSYVRKFCETHPFRPDNKWLDQGLDPRRHTAVYVPRAQIRASRESTQHKGARSFWRTRYSGLRTNRQDHGSRLASARPAIFPYVARTAHLAAL